MRSQVCGEIVRGRIGPGAMALTENASLGRTRAPWRGVMADRGLGDHARARLAAARLPMEVASATLTMLPAAHQGGNQTATA